MSLHGLDVFQHASWREGNIGIFETGFLQPNQTLGDIGALATGIDAITDTGAEWLPLETIRHGIHDIRLIALLFEFEFHAVKMLKDEW